MRITETLLVAMLLVGCGPFTSGGNDAGSSGGQDAGSGFSDKLEIGTGMSGFDLLGKATSFSLALTGNGNLAFRLESAADMGAQAVRFYIRTGSGSSSAPYAQKDFTRSQDYGHIFLVSPVRVNPAGTYEVRGYLVQQVGPDIGKETLIATSPLTLTQ